jgi:hypothetical protein
VADRGQRRPIAPPSPNQGEEHRMPTSLRRFAAGIGLSLLCAAAVASESDHWQTAHPDWIWCDDFDQVDWETAVKPEYFEQDVGNGTCTREAGVGLDGSTGLRIHFAAGAVGPGGLKVAFGRTPSSYFKPVDAGLATYREIYWRLYLKNQSGWTGGAADKLSRALVMATSGWAEAAFGHCWGGDSDNLGLDPASGTDAAGTLKTTKYNDFANMRWLGWTPGPTPIFDAGHVGVWRCIECHMKLNDAGASNGVFELWIDGQLEAQKSGLNWLGSYSAYGINMVFFENYWNNGSPVAQDRFFDNLVISTKPIGPVASGGSSTGGATSGGTTTGGTPSSTSAGVSTGGPPVVGTSGGGHSCGLGAVTGFGLALALLGRAATRAGRSR